MPINHDLFIEYIQEKHEHHVGITPFALFKEGLNKMNYHQLINNIYINFLEFLSWLLPIHIQLLTLQSILTICVHKVLQALVRTY